MTDLRTAAQQAIGLICSARLCEVNSMSSRQEMLRLLIEATDILRAALAQQAEPVAKVELMMTGGNAGLATRIVEIDDHLRERLRPGQLLYTSPPQHPDTDCHTQGICQRSGYGIGKQADPQIEDRLARHGINPCPDCRGIGYDASGQLCACQGNPSF